MLSSLILISDNETMPWTMLASSTASFTFFNLDSIISLYIKTEDFSILMVWSTVGGTTGGAGFSNNAQFPARYPIRHAFCFPTRHNLWHTCFSLHQIVFQNLFPKLTISFFNSSTFLWRTRSDGWGSLLLTVLICLRADSASFLLFSQLPLKVSILPRKYRQFNITFFNR